MYVGEFKETKHTYFFEITHCLYQAELSILINRIYSYELATYTRKNHKTLNSQFTERTKIDDKTLSAVHVVYNLTKMSLSFKKHVYKPPNALNAKPKWGSFHRSSSSKSAPPPLHTKPLQRHTVSTIIP